MYRMILMVAAVLGMLATAAVLMVRDWQQFRSAALIDSGEIRLWIAPGMSFDAVARQLETLGVGRRDWRWKLLGRLRQPRVQAGEYRIEPGLDVEGLLRKTATGDVLQHRFTIVEGWTVARLRRALAGDPRLHPVAADLSDRQLMERLGCPDCPAEGQFLPETYFFVRGTTDLALLAQAHTAMSTALEQVWKTRQADLPLDDPQQLLVLASIIERETGQHGERARIAGVFVRRLKRGMRLQTDPTVIYGLGEAFDGRLRRVDLRRDHPWNTYTRHGLPPTPIALPGRAALEAAANPAPGSALYFVSRGDGSHHFSDTLAEHNAAVDRYIRGRP